MESKIENASLGYVNNCEKSFNTSLNDKKDSPALSSVSLSSQQKLELSSWGLPERVLRFYENKGITRMFQWQIECLTLGGVLDAGNLVYSAPTSAGKTLVAEMLISKCVFEKQRKALVILPFVSVVREKMFYFQSMYSSSGIYVEGYMGGHSPSICFKEVHVAVCTIEKANSIINRLLEEQNLHKLGLVVVDELHLLGDPYRGYLLELLLTKLKYISSKSGFNIQIVGMSATLPNLKSLANWLNASLYYTEFRPVPLNEKLKCGTSIYDKKLNKLLDLTPSNFEALDDSENIGQLCVETISNGHSVLIFCPTKIWCENLAEKISLFFRKNGCSKSAETEGSPGWILRNQLNLEKINKVIEHLKMSSVGLDKDLHRTIAYGVAFHHAGLTLDERDIIEGSFRKGCIRVLCATSTLSSGVNLPARRVIIRSPMSFGGLMDILTYRQMIGRAGRMGVDSEGESILICKPNEKSLCQTLMCSSLKPIESCLGHGRLSASLKRAILEIIASGLAASPAEVKKYADCTFLAFSSKHNIEDPIQSCIEFLEENEFIRLQEEGTIYVPTPLAKACLASSLPPDEGLALFRELQRARRCFVLDTDLHIIYQVTPYSVSEQWHKIEWMNVLNILDRLPGSMKRVGEMVGVEEAFLIRVVKGAINLNSPEVRNKLSILRRFYTSLALQDLINEMPLPEVAEKYECNKGMLQSLQQSAATYAGMVTEFTKRLGWGSIELIFSQFQERLQFGVQRELCELMRLPLLNGVRARALFNAGFTSLSAIANAQVIDLENALLAMAPFQSKKQIAGETAYDKNQRNRFETVWITGKADISIREAAESLVTESRNILELELGLKGAHWGIKDNYELDKTQCESFNCSISNKSNRSLRRSGSENKTEELQSASLQRKPEVEDNNPLVGLEDNNKTESESICDKKDLIECININFEMKSLNCEEMKLGNIGMQSDQCNAHIKSLKTESKNSSIEMKEEGLFKINNCSNNASNAGHRSQKNKLEKTDYFASSFNFDMIQDYDIPENGDDHKVIDSDSCEYDSSGSVEILYDSTIHNASKNLSLTRLSEDIFEIPSGGNDSRKNESTPIAHQASKNVAESDRQLVDTRSPDLFSQSLTFDTQMGKVLDFEERPSENVYVIANPSGSFNSDDLGFVSDLSPPKPNQKVSHNSRTSKAEEEAGDKNCEAGSGFIEKEFKSPLREKKKETTKRRFSSCESPDVIVDFDRSSGEKEPKRAKYSSAEKESIGLAEKNNESDDEIMPTPKPDKATNNSSERHLNESIKSRTTNQSCKILKRSLSNDTVDNKTESDVHIMEISKIKVNKINWDKIDVIDVCETKEKFKFFCEQLKKENAVGLALGCRRKPEEKTNGIGMRIVKKRKLGSCGEAIFKCQYKDIILDGIAFYWRGNDVFYMTLDDGNVKLDDKIKLIESMCVKEKVCRVFDAKEQIKLLRRCCSTLLACSIQDPKIGCWLLSEKWKPKNFSQITLEFLPSCGNLVSLAGSIVGYSSPGLLAKSTTCQKIRACSDAFLTFHVIERQLALLRGKGLLEAFENTEMPVIVTLAEMELTGFQICRAGVLEIMAKLDGAKEKLEEQAYSLARHRFSLTSPAAVSEVLCTRLGLDGDNSPLKKKKRMSSVSKQALQELMDETKHPLPEIILEWRKIRSISNKFVFPLLKISSESTRVYGVHQTFTVTGRISMQEPNLQNIPKNFTLNCGNHEATTINLREVFVASESCVLLSVDYCQIELRMLAHLSRDFDLIRDINESADIFVGIAASIYGVPHYDVDDNLRQSAKQTCYGMVYGIGAQNLSQQLKIELSDAVKLMEGFKNKYKGVASYLQRIVSECRSKGYVVTLSNRRRYLPAINDSNQAVRGEAERQAINTTVQGSAADLVKNAMVVWRERLPYLIYNGITANLVLHLHDELIFEVGEDAVQTVAVILKDTMETASDLLVPTPVKIKTGRSWGQLENYELSNA